MKKPVQISIPTPCHEDWDKMTPGDKGRFCAACQKNVIDFTRSSDREIASYLKQNENVCGRFTDNQLDRELIVPSEKSQLWPVAAAISFMSIGITTANAQTPQSTEQHIPESKLMLGKVAPPQKIISGTVADPDGPLAGVNITIEGTEVCIATDIKGEYSIEAGSGKKLVFSYHDLIIQENIVDNQTKVINVSLESRILDGVTVQSYKTKSITRQTVSGAVTLIAERVEKRRTFFGRIFHSIGNLFR